MYTDRKRNTLMPIIIVFVLCSIAMIASGVISLTRNENLTNNNSVSQFSNGETGVSEEADTTESVTDENGNPYVVSTAKIGSAGDILIHKPILESAKHSDGSYDFNHLFTSVAPVIKSYDYFIANLEVTCGGAERGYSTYPCFNIPDTIVDATKNAGIDCLLTANNHCYDSSEKGVLRTQEVIKNAGLDYTGTIDAPEKNNYLVKEINGIKFGFVVYTYETNSETGTAINGINITDNASHIINTFHYSTLDKFYSRLGTQLTSMKQEGADVLVVYLHWGDEYHLSQNSWQKTMAQKLADMGVDAIIGGHPHVVQPMDLITSTDGKHKTVCLYSMGNFVSNQRRDLMPIKDGHTEDGLIFEMNFSKYSDGSVKFDNVDVIPTWVHKYKSEGRDVHRITPLQKDMSSKASELGLNNSSSGLSLATGSYQRTMDLVGEGLKKCNDFLSAPPVELVTLPDDITQPIFDPTVSGIPEAA